MRAFATPPLQRRLRLAAGRTAVVAPTAVPRAEPHAAPVRLGGWMCVCLGGGWRAHMHEILTNNLPLSPSSPPAPLNSTAASASPRFGRPHLRPVPSLRWAGRAWPRLTGGAGRPRLWTGELGWEEREKAREGFRRDWGVEAPHPSSAHHSPTRSSLYAKLKRYGLAGLLSYGVLNTLWYSCAFITAASVTGPPAGGGWNAAASKAAQVLAMTWAGSQVTKAARLAAAVLLAPLADRLLDGVRASLRLRSKKAAFLACVVTLCACASGVFVGRTLAWV